MRLPHSHYGQRLLHLTVAALTLGGSACSAPAGGGPVEPPAPDCAPSPGVGVNAYVVGELDATSVLPASTGRCVTLRPDSHFVYASRSVPLRGRLFLFLPGTGAIAQNYRLVAQEAARAGYHAVSLSYVNDTPVGTLCAGQSATCYEQTRDEILTGLPRSGVVVVDRGNSIESRVVRLLRYMQQRDPARAWTQFVQGDSTLRWDRIAVAGHSQGGGHALFIARQHAVFRVASFASAGDLVAGIPVPWMTTPFATPAARIYGFISERDELVPFAPTITAWSGLGLAAFGPVVSVDSAAPPFGGSHMLSTTATPLFPGVVIGPNHNVVVVDANTPRAANGTPVFAGIWRYLGVPDER
ncbi:MAG: BPSS1187 family protein [Gemmatimonas sp.]|jgi:dienelactone hydrolase|uniref:BPSS1187 family protein n=1 Tax=Gemmatimonas sp. TaxID=1962908 RepID=UPI00391EF228